MALYAEITLRAANGKTEINVQVDSLRNGVYTELWRRTALSDYAADVPDHLAEPWLYMVLSPFLERFSQDVVVVQGDELDEQTAGEVTGPLPVLPDAPLT